MKHNKHFSTCVYQSGLQMLNEAPPPKKCDRMSHLLVILFIGQTWKVGKDNYVNYCQLIILFWIGIKLNSSHVFVVVPHLKWAFGNVFTSTWGSNTFLVVFHFNCFKIFWRSNIHWQQLLVNELLRPLLLTPYNLDSNYFSHPQPEDIRSANPICSAAPYWDRAVCFGLARVLYSRSQSAN